MLSNFSTQQIKKIHNISRHKYSSENNSNSKGDVILVEFFDYQCGHCKAINQFIQNLVKQNKDLRVVFKRLPVVIDQSQLVAKISLLSVTQGKYCFFHDVLLNTNDSLTNDSVFEIAKNIGLNIDQVKKDMNDPAIQKQLRDNFQLARSIQPVSTPMLVIGNKASTNFRFTPPGQHLNKISTPKCNWPSKK